MKRKFLIAISLSIIVSSLYFGYKANSSYLKRYPRVHAALVNRNDLAEDIEELGTVTADNIRDLYAIPGTKVEAVMVKEGDPVRAGQTMIVFNSNFQKLQLAECEADILRTEQELAIKKLEGYSENGLRINQAYLDALRLRKSVLEKQIREMTLVSPINGMVSLLTVKGGEYLDGNIRIAQIIDESRLTVEAEIKDDDGLKIKIGDPAEISFGTIAKPYAAEVIQILPPVKNHDNSYGNLRIKLRPVEPGTPLIPGSKVQVRVRIGRAKLAVTVPVEAIREELTTVRGDREYFSIRPETGSKRKYVYVLRDCSETLKPAQEKERRWMIRDNVYQARKVYVETGVSGNDRIEVLKGLEPFEQVIVSSDRPVYDYDRVIVINRDESYKEPITVGSGVMR